MTPPSGNTPEQVGHPKAGEHTPTPWTSIKFGDTKSTTLYHENGVASLGSIKSQEDAKFIVEACNNYDTLRARNAKLVEAASKWSRCCDLWQDGLGGMHCTECSQKTFAMLYEIQKILGISKGGNARTESENAHE